MPLLLREKAKLSKRQKKRDLPEWQYVVRCTHFRSDGKAYANFRDDENVSSSE